MICALVAIAETRINLNAIGEKKTSHCELPSIYLHPLPSISTCQSGERRRKSPIKHQTYWSNKQFEMLFPANNDVPLLAIVASFIND